jgi:hypothetical protein
MLAKYPDKRSLITASLFLLASAFPLLVRFSTRFGNIAVTLRLRIKEKKKQNLLKDKRSVKKVLLQLSLINY